MGRTNKEIFASGDVIWGASGGEQALFGRPYHYLNDPVYSYDGSFYSKAALELRLNDKNISYDETTLEKYRHQ